MFEAALSIDTKSIAAAISKGGGNGEEIKLALRSARIDALREAKRSI